ncbi:MAG: hypothetical protein ACOC44_06820 [Promethearchaeia archaeon]
MVFKRLDEKISSRLPKRLLILSILVLFIIYPIMGYFFMVAGSPANIMESQLSFSADYMKQYYASIADLNTYRIAEILDYGFMVSYGLLSFSLAFIIGRSFEKGTVWRSSGMIAAFLALIAPSCDALENMFILLMLENPTRFPDFYALAHSSFALIKWILLGALIIWALIALIISLIKKD